MQPLIHNDVLSLDVMNFTLGEIKHCMFDNPQIFLNATVQAYMQNGLSPAEAQERATQVCQIVTDSVRTIFRQAMTGQAVPEYIHAAPAVLN